MFISLMMNSKMRNPIKVFLQLKHKIDFGTSCHIHMGLGMNIETWESSKTNKIFI